LRFDQLLWLPHPRPDGQGSSARESPGAPSVRAGVCAGNGHVAGIRGLLNWSAHLYARRAFRAAPRGASTPALTDGADQSTDLHWLGRGF